MRQDQEQRGLPGMRADQTEHGLLAHMAMADAQGRRN